MSCATRSSRRHSAAAADDAREAWVTRHPEVKAGILTSTWQVPVAWFTVFEAAERRLVLGDRRAAGGGTDGLDRAMVYLTAMSRARRRVAQALRIVRKIFDEGPATAAIEDVGRWLEGFPPALPRRARLRRSRSSFRRRGPVRGLLGGRGRGVAGAARGRRRGCRRRVLREGDRPVAVDRSARTRQLIAAFAALYRCISV